MLSSSGDRSRGFQPTLTLAGHTMRMKFGYATSTGKDVVSTAFCPPCGADTIVSFRVSEPNVELTNKINALFRRLKRFGCTTCNITVSDLIDTSGRDLFRKLCSSASFATAKEKV